MSFLSFNQFVIAEEKVVQNKHSTHLEDLVLDGGKKSADNIISSLTLVYDKFSSKSKTKDIGVSVKYDGAPAVFFGCNPENGKFFVGTKAIFNKVPKINYDETDIDNNHSGDLNVKLKACLKYLKPVCPKNGNIFQGDLMFTDGDLDNISVGGVDYVSCHPNTIVYAVPKNSTLAKEWKSAKVGIVMHTRYTGTDIANMQASFGVLADEFNKSSKVWIEDAYYKSYDGVLTFTAEESTNYKKTLNKASSLVSKIKSTTYNLLSGDINQLINTYNNTFIRNNQMIDSVKKAEGFKDYIVQKFDKEIDKRKSEAGKQKQIDKRDELLKSIPDVKELTKVYDLQLCIVELKNMIMFKLDHVASMNTFVISNDGQIKVTGQEGYVGLTDSDIPQGVKLVDRYEFSFNNFSPSIRKGFQKDR